MKVKRYERRYIPPQEREYPLSDLVSKVVIGPNASNEFVKVLESYRLAPSVIQHKEWKKCVRK